ncbi:hypothetical protein ACR34G_03395 [Mycoplasma sp. 480]|uniref:hypothetical protein n=1 Tax=Mycoplasma sp. 480 TaxID=3440155 RepID=UPI003F515326
MKKIIFSLTAATYVALPVISVSAYGESETGYLYVMEINGVPKSFRNHQEILNELLKIGNRRFTSAIGLKDTNNQYGQVFLETEKLYKYDREKIKPAYRDIFGNYVDNQRLAIDSYISENRIVKKYFDSFNNPFDTQEEAQLSIVEGIKENLTYNPFYEFKVKEVNQPEYDLKINPFIQDDIDKLRDILAKENVIIRHKDDLENVKINQEKQGITLNGNDYIYHRDNTDLENYLKNIMNNFIDDLFDMKNENVFKLQFKLVETKGDKNKSNNGFEVSINDDESNWSIMQNDENGLTLEKNVSQNYIDKYNVENVLETMKNSDDYFTTDLEQKYNFFVNKVGDVTLRLKEKNFLSINNMYIKTKTKWKLNEQAIVRFFGTSIAPVSILDSYDRAQAWNNFNIEVNLKLDTNKLKRIFENRVKNLTIQTLNNQITLTLNKILKNNPELKEKYRELNNDLMLDVESKKKFISESNNQFISWLPEYIYSYENSISKQNNKKTLNKNFNFNSLSVLIKYRLLGINLDIYNIFMKNKFFSLNDKFVYKNQNNISLFENIEKDDYTIINHKKLIKSPFNNQKIKYINKTDSTINGLNQLRSIWLDYYENNKTKKDEKLLKILENFNEYFWKNKEFLFLENTKIGILKNFISVDNAEKKIYNYNSRYTNITKLANQTEESNLEEYLLKRMKPKERYYIPGLKSTLISRGQPFREELFEFNDPKIFQLNYRLILGKLILPVAERRFYVEDNKSIEIKSNYYNLWTIDLNNQELFFDSQEGMMSYLKDYIKYRTKKIEGTK